ncbi:MAG: hypothetical protein VKL41_10185 [Snowella sp.]|nr:hypothetical protein [Snowella sp.]
MNKKKLVSRIFRILLRKRSKKNKQRVGITKDPNTNAVTNLDSFFLYYQTKLGLKLRWFLNHSLGYLIGFPISMTTDSCFKIVKKFNIGFFGLEEEEYNQIINQHKKQFSTYYDLAIIILLISLIFFMFFLQSSNILKVFFNSTIATFLFFIFSAIIMPSIFFRLLFRLMDYLSPEALCAMQIIDLNLELSRNDVIYKRNVKSMVLFRMDYLARVTMLIPWHYSMGRNANQKWIQQHFQNIAYYIRERRRWLITPTETTLEDIRRDFRELAYLYLTGLYGNWQWQSFELETEIIKQTRFQKIQGTLIRFVGIILPLLIMAFYILFPDKFPNADAEILKNLPYIFIAWLLVSLDITLKLGVIESLTKLITGLKDLSK